MPSSQLNFGVTIGWGEVSEYVESAKILERSGFDSFWLSDETMVFGSPSDVTVPDIFPTMAMVASNTWKLGVCSAVVDASMRYPIKTAQSMATVDSISGGRTKFGVGAGEAVNREPFGVPVSKNYSRLKEAIECIKLLFESSPNSPVNYSGEFYSLKNAFLKIKPKKRPRPPLIISAFGPNSLRLAGEIGDGWISYNHTPETYARTLNGSVREGANAAHRRVEDLETAIVFAACLHKNREKAQASANSIAKEWLVWSPDNLKILLPNFEHPGLRETYLKKPGDETVKKLGALARNIPDDVATKTTISGNSEDCIRQIELFAKAGCKNFIFYISPVDESWQDTISNFSKQVLIHVRD